MNYELDPTCADDFPDERAYDLAAKRHAKADAFEQRETGGRLDPMPTFDEWTSTGGDDAEC